MLSVEPTHPFNAHEGIANSFEITKLAQNHRDAAATQVLGQPLAVTNHPESSAASLPAQSMFPAQTCNAYADVNNSFPTEHDAQIYMDLAPAQPISQSFAVTDPLKPPASDLSLLTPIAPQAGPSQQSSNNKPFPNADLFLSTPMVQRAYPTPQLFPNVPRSEDLNPVSEVYDYSWPNGLGDPNNNIDWTYFCFNKKGQLVSDTRASMPIAPKPLPRDPGTIVSEMPGLTSLNNSPPLLPQKKRKRYDETEREKVRRVRRLGACFRCKIYKLPVGRCPPSVLQHN